MEIDVTDGDSRSYGHRKGLNRTIQVHVKKRILVVPDSWLGMGHFVTHVPDAIVTVIRLDLGY